MFLLLLLFVSVDYLNRVKDYTQKKKRIEVLIISDQDTNIISLDSRKTNTLVPGRDESIIV